MAKDVDTELVDLYVAQELKMAELYGIFAERYPEHRDFWTSMADEEKRHAAAIRELSEKARSGRACFSGGQVRINAVRSFLAYVDRVVAKAKRDPTPFLTALSVTRDIESSLIEKNAFEVFRGDTPEVKSLLVALRDETAGHAARLDAMWRKGKGVA